MKDAILGIVVLALAVAGLVAAYYIGIVAAVIGVILMVLGIGALIVTFLAYAIWEAWQEFKKKQRSR